MNLSKPIKTVWLFAIDSSDHPERAWVLTDFDTWEPNPYYNGPAVPHPEDDYGNY